MPLFELAKKLYKGQIYAYYYDLLFEETLPCHKTKLNCNEFGEHTMRRWWIIWDYSRGIVSQRGYKDDRLEDTINYIYEEVCSDRKVKRHSCNN